MSETASGPGALNDAATRLGGAASASTTRRCATASRPSASCSTPPQKLEIARALDALGIDRIEAGFPRVVRGRHEAVAADRRRRASTPRSGASRARCRPTSRRCVELGVRFAVIESPISDRKLDAIGVSRETMLERITTALRFAAEPRHPRARFFGVDSHPRRPRLLPARATRARSRRAPRSSSSSTRSGSLPRGGRRARRERRSSCVGADVPVHFHGHNDFGLATASAVAAVAGRRRLGPRDDQRHGRAGRQRQPRRGRAGAARALRRRVEPAPRADPRGLRARRGALGLRARAVEAAHRRDAFTGARAARSRASSTTRPRSSRTPRELVGAPRRIVLGKKSGLDSIRIKAGRARAGVPAGAAGRRCSPRSRRSALASTGWSATTSSRALVRCRLSCRRVCVAGAGAIGSLLAGAPRRVCEVVGAHPPARARPSAERARACSVSGKHELIGGVQRHDRRRPSCPSLDLGIICLQGHRPRARRGAARRPLRAAATMMTLQNGLGAEDVIAAPRRLAADLAR